MTLVLSVRGRLLEDLPCLRSGEVQRRAAAVYLSFGRRAHNLITEELVKKLGSEPGTQVGGHRQEERGHEDRDLGLGRAENGGRCM